MNNPIVQTLLLVVSVSLFSFGCISINRRAKSTSDDERLNLILQVAVIIVGTCLAMSPILAVIGMQLSNKQFFFVDITTWFQVIFSILLILVAAVNLFILAAGVSLLVTSDEDKLASASH